MKICPYCLANNNDEAQFCSNCGNEIGNGWVCRSCRFVNLYSGNGVASFCGNCGKPADALKEIIQDEISNHDLMLDVCAHVAESLAEKITAGFYNNKEPVCIDVRRNGNIVINTDSASVSDKDISEFVSKICLKIYDNFPLGAVSINFYVGDVDDVYFSKFRIGGEQDTYQPARTFKGNYSDVEKYLENKCDELLYGKISGNIKDFYDLYEIDSSEHLDYVVIRNGFYDLSASKGSAFMAKLNSAFDIKNNSAYHRCGIRYIIINDLGDMENLETLKNNADLVIDYNGSGFFVGKEQFNSLICPDGNLENFIETKCKNIGEELNKTARKIIRCEEIGFGQLKPVDRYSAVIKIPVGKCGSETTEIPFSCNDREGTFTGKNIGMMVLGSSRSGKSSLYNSMIINGSYKYSPSDLNFWLLDFKSNAAAGIYSNSPINIPHIKLVAPNSKISDGYSILMNLREEMDYRYKRFSQFERNGQKVSNLAEFNKVVETNKEEQKSLPRIILMVDEAQEMFRDDSAVDASNDYPNEIANLINVLVSKGAAAGIHLALFAQNLDFGKTYRLKDCFISQIQYKICFRLDANSVANCGFGMSFMERRDEIAYLNTGVMYHPAYNEKLGKSKVAYIEDNEFQNYFHKIIERYSNKSEILKIGLTEKLKFDSKIAMQDRTYLSEIKNPSERDGVISCVLGEDAYKLRPVKINFSARLRASSSAFIIGNSSAISTSILTSLLISLRRYEIIICDGTQRGINTSFKEVLKEMAVKKYQLSSLVDCIRDIYKEYADRKEIYSKDENYIAKPLFVFLNDFEYSEQIANNLSLKQSLGEKTSAAPIISSILNANTIDDVNCHNMGSNFSFDIRIKEAIGKILDDGHNYNIFLILTLKDTYIREFEKAYSSSPNVIFFNDFRFPISLSYKLKNCLRDMRQGAEVESIVNQDFENVDEEDKESFAVISRNDGFIKFRPVIYSIEPSPIENLKNQIKEL